MTRRDIERRLSDLEDERGPDDGPVLYFHEETVATEWEPSDPEESAPEPGHEFWRCYINDWGERVTEELTESEYQEAVR